MANKILSDEEIKDKILSLDIAKECYAYYYKILYDKYLQLLKCHQSEAAEIKELKSQLESCVNTLKERDNQLEKAETRIKELETKTESCRGCDQFFSTQISEAKAEARKEIGTLLYFGLPTGQVDAFTLIKWLKHIVNSLQDGVMPKITSEGKKYSKLNQKEK